jgi:ABC-type molybdate transport system permease subunit
MIAGNLPGKTQTLSMAIYDAVQAGNDELANILVMIIFNHLHRLHHDLGHLK